MYDMLMYKYVCNCLNMYVCNKQNAMFAAKKKSSNFTIDLSSVLQTDVRSFCDRNLAMKMIKK